MGTLLNEWPYIAMGWGRPFYGQKRGYNCRINCTEIKGIFSLENAPLPLGKQPENFDHEKGKRLSSYLPEGDIFKYLI